MKKIILLVLTLTLLSLKPALNQQVYKLTVKQPPPLSIIIPEEVNIAVAEVVNLDNWLSVEGDASFVREWKFNNGTTIQTIDNPLYTISVGGLFYITVTNEFGCTILDSIVLDIVTGLEEIRPDPNNRQQIHVYPNPNTGEFDVVISDCQPGYYLELVNSAGVQILSRMLDCNNNDYLGTIRVPSVNPGVYYLLIKHAGQLIYRQKVIILK
jgi:hypothetical protein